MQTSFPLLSLLLWLPLIGALLMLLVPRDNPKVIRNLALIISLADLLIALVIFFRFDSNLAGPQFVEKWSWISSLGVSYYLGIDGISLLLVMLTAFLAPIAILSTYKAVDDRVKGFMFSILLLQVGMLGAFLALDVFFFYIFWELMLIPMYFIIGIWGGARRIYAAIKFFLFTLFGSLLMLVAILVVFFTHHAQTGIYTADLLQLYNTGLSSTTQLWLFAAFAVAFAIKVPMFPFHTWLPDAHVEAPTAGSVILAAVLLKMGTYGFIRFAFPLFPRAAIEFVPIIAILAVVGIIYGALVAMVQKDVKKLIAYSSVSHLGFVMLGIVALTPAAVSGGLLQMINHGISTGLLFLLVGIIYERRHTREISEFGGLAKQMPWYATCFMIATLASIGLPGTNGFIGEFLVLIGTFNSDALPFIFGSSSAGYILATVAGLGVILGAVYMLWMVQRVFFGPLKNPKNQKLKDLSLREAIVMLPLILLIFLIGLFPNLLLGRMEKSINSFIKDVRERSRIAQVIDDSTAKHELPQLMARVKPEEVRNGDR
ncbi:MAG: NADH-quinone oxidoreductase subunit M [Deltaproteobacteria bacterium]|nr:NADH-quinone oxidoreductase subunit M [Deltaproteobacteria bacterium]